MKAKENFMAQGQKEILQFQAQRTVTVLCKYFLNILEDLADEYDRYFDQAEYMGGASLSKGMPENFLNDKHFSYLRKKVLDKGGDASRELLQELDRYNVRLMTNEELQAQGKI